MIQGYITLMNQHPMVHRLKLIQMPFHGDGWNYKNCAMTKHSNSDYTFELPNEFVNASEKYIVVRQCRVLFGLTTGPEDHVTNDVLLLSDFVDEKYLISDEVNKAFNIKNNSMGYVCICNDTNAKKKRFKYVWKSPIFHIGFSNLYEDAVIPTSYIFDFLLVWR
jgi:hypothetical protein